MKKFLFLLAVCFFSFQGGRAHAQAVPPLDMKQWYGESTRGAAPPTWNTQSYVFNNGLLNANNLACMQAADANCNATMVPPAGVVWEVRVRDGNGATLADVIQPTADGIAGNAYYDLATASFLHGYDSANSHWDRIRTDANGALIVNQSTSVPGYGRIQDGDGATLADVAALAVNSIHGLNALTTGSGTYFYDGKATKWNWWYGYDLATDGVGTTTVAPYASSFLMGYDSSNSHWDRVHMDTAGNLIVNQSTSVPGYGRIQDGDSTVLADVEDNQADGKATTLNSLVTSSVQYVYNGATLDMVRSGAVKEVQMTDVATRPGEDAANDWRKIKKESLANLVPAKTDTGSFTTVTTIYPATDVSQWPNWTVYVQNTGANALTDCYVETSPDNTTWASLSAIEDATEQVCNTCAAGAMCIAFKSHSSALRYIRARATAGVATTTSAWLVANTN